VTAPAASWQRDSGTAGGQAADLVWRVLSGIGQLELTAELSGTIGQPALHVRSNLDQAVSDQLRALVGEEVAAAEARVRAMVDRFADEQVAPVRAQVARVTAEVTDRLQQQRQALDTAQQQIEQQLRRLTRGIRLP
jgi:ribosome-associated translation inhibitor RaiA